MNACQGKDVPLDIIERWLKDSDWRVRAAAMNACQGKDVPLIRTIEPPEKVYKKCIGGVIVVATIPADAQVRGTHGDKCRCNKAKIVDIIGEVMGERVGISQYDKKTIYCIGDDVEITDFDYSNERCASGFHFFCTMQEARNYDFS